MEGTRLRSPTGNVPMKMLVHPARVFLAAILTLVAFHALAYGQVIIGTGDDVSYAVIEAEQFGAPLVYEYHYTYNPAKPPDGFDLFAAIDLADPNLSLGFANLGDGESPSYFLDSITYRIDEAHEHAFSKIRSILGPVGQWRSGGVYHARANRFGRMDFWIGNFDAISGDWAWVVGRIRLQHGRHPSLDKSHSRAAKFGSSARRNHGRSLDASKEAP